MIYFDYNATHPPFTDILKQGVDAYSDNFANASGISYPSQKNQGRIEKARQQIADDIEKLHQTKINPDQILFVSTGTEALHHLVAAFANLIQSNVSSKSNSKSKPVILTSPYEHGAFEAACRFSNLSIERLPANQDGLVDLDSVRQRLRQGGIDVVSVMSICNESGVIQPVHKIAKVCAEFEIPFFSDTIQSAGKLPVSFDQIQGGILNGHKIGAGYGCAAVWLGEGISFQPIFQGGLQENERRAGTENLPAILSLAASLKRQLQHIESENRPFRHSRHKRIEEMLIQTCDAAIVGERSDRSNTSYAVFSKMQNMDFLLMALDKAGILCSTGSSCKSRTRQPASSLIQMGFSANEALQALRFSTGLFTTDQETDQFIELFPSLYRKCL